MVIYHLPSIVDYTSSFLNFHLFMVIYHLPSIVDYTRFFLNFHLFMVIYHIPSIVDYTSFMRKVSVVVLCHSVAVLWCLSVVVLVLQHCHNTEKSTCSKMFMGE